MTGPIDGARLGEVVARFLTAADRLADVRARGCDVEADSTGTIYVQGPLPLAGACMDFLDPYETEIAAIIQRESRDGVGGRASRSA